MSSATPQLFPLSRLGALLGMKPQSVAWHFRDVSPAGIVVVSGNEAKGYTFDAFPESIRRELLTIGNRRGFRDVIGLLCDSEKQWQPAIPVSEIAPAYLRKASSVQRALRPWLENRLNLAERMTAGEMELRAVEDYAREVGTLISERRWRDLFSRSLARDKGREEWDRVEL